MNQLNHSLKWITPEILFVRIYIFSIFHALMTLAKHLPEKLIATTEQG